MIRACGFGNIHPSPQAAAGHNALAARPASCCKSPANLPASPARLGRSVPGLAPWREIVAFAGPGRGAGVKANYFTCLFGPLSSRLTSGRDLCAREEPPTAPTISKPLGGGHCVAGWPLNSPAEPAREQVDDGLVDRRRPPNATFFVVLVPWELLKTNSACASATSSAGSSAHRISTTPANFSNATDNQDKKGVQPQRWQPAESTPCQVAPPRGARAS